MKKGFTLIELIIYLAIVSTVLVSISYLIIEIISGQTRAIAFQEVNQNIRFISQIITRDIREAEAISSLSADSMTLTMPGDDVVYTFEPSDLTLTRQLGAGAAEVLNTDRVEATGTFSDLSFTTRSANVGVELIIEYKNPDNLQDYKASTTVNFSSELRGRR